MTDTLYKVLNENGSARMGVGSWHLPSGKRPGKWMPAIEGDLVPCENGYHLCREQDLLEWLGPAIFEVEYRGEMIEADDKIVVRRARLLRKCGGWNERTARLFAADCAERALPVLEKYSPKHIEAARTAVDVARRYANGEATAKERAAARDATRAAARAAAWDAARAAAWAATRDATRDAAWDAAWAAARDAARDAARAAAWDATWDATRDATRDAAWDAARAAAWDAEKQWQQKRLFDYLTGRTG